MIIKENLIRLILEIYTLLKLILSELLYPVLKKINILLWICIVKYSFYLLMEKLIGLEFRGMRVFFTSILAITRKERVKLYFYIFT
jgi:hypothetical protein